MILIIDCGSQTTHLIARRLKDLGRTTIIVSPESAYAYASSHTEVTHIVISGGPHSVYETGAPHIDHQVYTLDIPLLGICYGLQLIAQDLGGTVTPGKTSELGMATITVDPKASTLCTKIQHSVWMNHGDYVSKLPPGFVSTAHTAQIPHAIIEHPGKHIVGLQFHPEVAHTPDGIDMLARFVGVTEKCVIQNAKNGAITPVYTDALITSLQTQIPPAARVICALSGGVDSSVAALLVHKAIGERLTCVYIDSGLMREGETSDLHQRFKSEALSIRVVHAADEFIHALAGITDPELKRKAIGKMFITILEREAYKEGASHLVQGTIYPDIIESAGSTHASNIKSHHNVGGLPKNMKLTLVEPLKELYKDEVRQVGALLGMNPVVLKRHPFPGPGLAIRIIGAVTAEKISVVRHADLIVQEEIFATGIADTLWQFFAIHTGIQTTGIRGDARVYGDTIALRAIESKDVMSASVAELPYELLKKISTRITNEIRSVNRVVYDITSKPPGTIEWE